MVRTAPAPRSRRARLIGSSPGSAPPGDSRLLTLVGPVAGVAVALWLVLPVLGGRPPAGEDVMAHLVRADFGISHLVAHGRLDGWFPRFVLGHQEFLFNGPGLTWVMALARALTFGALSNAGALKVVCIASVAAIPPAMWFLTRSYGLGRRAAGLAAVLALLVSNPFGPGLEGTFTVGLISHQVGAVFFCLALGACVRLTQSRHRGWVLLAAAALAALVVTHLISVVVFAVFLALTLVALAAARRLSLRGLARLALAGAGAAGLAAFWLLPALAHRDLRGVVTTWGTPPLGDHLRSIVTGEVLLPTRVALVMAAGWVWQLARLRRHPLALAWVATPLAYLLVAHGALNLDVNEVTLQLVNRGVGYAGLLGVLSIAALVAAGTRRWGGQGYLVVVTAAAVAVVAWAPGREAVGQLSEPIPQMRAAATELARRVPDGARFATQRDFPSEIERTGVIHPEIWLARTSGRNSLNGFNLESSSTPEAAFEADELDERSPAVSARRLARLGVTHVVATTDGLAAELAGSGRFRPVWRSSPLAILALRPAPGRPEPASLLSAAAPITGRLLAAHPERLSFAVRTQEPAVVTVALAWSPKWHGRLGDDAVDLGRTGDGLVRVRLPAGSSRLVLDYRPDGWDRLGFAVSSLTLALMAGAVLRGRQLMSRIFSRTA